jgi:protocatechuate 3,4-dioxygenase beta subunit
MQARRSLVWVVVVVFVALVVWWFGGDGETPAGAPDRSAAARDASVEESAAPFALENTSAALAGARTSVVDEQPLAPTNTNADAGRALLTGTVVDANGAPQEGARITLASPNVWAAGAVVPGLVGERGYFGFETRTDASGRFAFDVVVPTTKRQRLAVEPHRHLERLDIYFGGGKPQDPEVLAAGERDLGELRVETRGALVGRVVDAAGSPLADVEISTQLSGTSGNSHPTRSDRAGGFVLGSLAAGQHELTAKLPGYALLRAGPFEVAVERDVDVGTLALTTATTIAGHVVDESGAPVADARINGRSTSEFVPTETTSAHDGSFTLALFVDEPHSVTVRAKGFEPWGDEFAGTSVFANGTSDARIVLKQRSKTRFVVLDAATRAPIERFAFAILEGEGSGSGVGFSGGTPRLPAVAERPGGVCEAFARQHVDAIVVLADTHIAYEGDVVHDVEGVPTQTILLQAAKRITGRVLRDGEPLPGAAVTLTPGFMVSRSTPDATRDSAATWEFTAHPRHPVDTATTDSDGRFAIVARSEGQARLEADVGEGRSLVRVPVQITQREDVDLGDLHATASGSIAGQLVVPSGFDPAGLWVTLGRGADAQTEVVDAAGRFTFANLHPGTHFVQVAARGAEFAGTERIAVLVEAGVVAELVIDASGAGSTEVEIEFALTGFDATGLEVYLAPVEHGRTGANLGRVDADGRARGTVPALGEVYATLWANSGSISFADQPFVLAANAQVSVRLERAFGSVEVFLPQDLELPEAALFELTLSTRADAPSKNRIHHEWTQRGESPSLPNGVRAIDGGVAFDAEEGTYDVRWRLCSADAALEFIRQPDGTLFHGRPALHEHVGEVVVRAGERAVVRLQ